jgi:hypothetical protein
MDNDSPGTAALDLVRAFLDDPKGGKAEEALKKHEDLLGTGTQREFQLTAILGLTAQIAAEAARQLPEDVRTAFLADVEAWTEQGEEAKSDSDD